MKPNRIVAACALFCLAAWGGAAFARAPSLGIFETQADVGATGLAGAAAYDPATGVFRVTGGGANIWADKDSFHFVWTRRSGDLHIRADVDWIGPGSDPHRKAGLMMRANLTPGSPYADVMVHGNGLVALQYREVQDGPTHEIMSNVPGAHRVRLEREGDYVYFSVAGPDGVLRHAGGNYRIPLPGPYYVGLALSAHNDSLTETATFSHVAIHVPVLARVADTGYPAAVESSLEVLHLEDPTNRRVVRHFATRIEAPNWSRDGASLIYNSGGLIYRIPVAGGDPVRIDTGPNRKINNDHGLSPDGAWLIVSDQTDPDNASRLYLLPLAGSEAPRLVVGVPASPSYWHGWSPDGKTIAYVANRPETRDFEIYTRELAGGPERRLTNSPGLDDGPEYSPDGRTIYFNSVRSGAMQIWRMRADGSGAEQVTSDRNYRDWFPHVSPDGKWIVFISFGLDVPIGDHPPNRDAVLRIMPADGSAPPTVLTRLFGGQGTINVPSWSPDSKSIAFVSYRLVR
jgi:Tol biopolymer transport system component